MHKFLPQSIVSEETIVPTDQIFTKTASYKVLYIQQNLPQMFLFDEKVFLKGTIVALKKLNINKQKIDINRSMLLELKKVKYTWRATSLFMT